MKYLSICFYLLILGALTWAQKPEPPQLKPAAPLRYQLHAGDVLERPPRVE